MKTQTKKTQENLDPKETLRILKEGNDRFVHNMKLQRNLQTQVLETSSGQFPFAVILSCIDSRVPTEIIFDRRIGDVFCVRIAGNFVNEDILGSIEFACAAAGSKLIVVLGHSSCGAVKGACDYRLNGEGNMPENLIQLLKKIHPAIDTTNEDGDRSSANAEFVQKVADKNVEVAMEQLREKSPVLKGMLDEGKIGMVGAMYSVATGEVTFGNL